MEEDLISFPDEPVKGNHLLHVPVEIVHEIGHYLPTRDLRSLSNTCRQLHTVIMHKGFWHEEEVTEERDFDHARLRLQDIRRRNVIQLTYAEVVEWPQSREAKFAHELKKHRDDYNFLDICVYRWGNGILYCAMSNVDVMWDKQLARQLPMIHRSGSLINRAITSCFNVRTFNLIINAYAMRYPDALLGTKTIGVRRRFTGLNYNNDPVPLFWACNQGRDDLINIMYTRGYGAALGKAFDLVTDDHNQLYTFPSESGTNWAWVYEKNPQMIDMWESAFNPRDSFGRPCPGIHEDVCLLLLEANLGFASRPNGIPIAHLAEAAVQKKLRLVQALIPYYKARLTPKKFQRALTLAVHAASRGWTTREPAQPKQAVHDNHRYVLDALLRAGSSLNQLRQNPHRKDDRGLLARAVRCAPHNAMDLLRLQMRVGESDRRDLRAAVVEAMVHLNGRRRHQDAAAARLEALRSMVHTGGPGNDDLAARLRFLNAAIPWASHLASDRRQFDREMQEICYDVGGQASVLLYHLLRNQIGMRLITI
ncbi:hypothetical protein PG990_014379 [Apiospora arundinis]